MKLFVVSFTRIGQHRNRAVTVEARSAKDLEGPIKEAIKGRYLPENKEFTVTFEDETMKGQLDYGLTGEFTVQQIG